MTITIQNESGSTLKVTINFYANIEAFCGGIAISPEFGSAFSDEFEISLTDCYDGDNEEYPLYYSYGLQWYGFYLPLVVKSESP